VAKAKNFYESLPDFLPPGLPLFDLYRSLCPGTIVQSVENQQLSDESGHLRRIIGHE
jgi:hypothetical protein